MMAVDEMYGDLPMMERDRYWNDSNPRPPYTAATLFVLRKPSFQGSTFDMASVLSIFNNLLFILRFLYKDFLKSVFSCLKNDSLSQKVCYFL